MQNAAEVSKVNKENRFLCNHTFEPTQTKPGHRCGSPALRGEDFCYYHHPTRSPVRNPHERRARRIARQSFNLPIPRNQAELYFYLNELVRRITANQIDSRRAGLVLFALQTVAKNF